MDNNKNLPKEYYTEVSWISDLTSRFSWNLTPPPPILLGERNLLLSQTSTYHTNYLRHPYLATDLLDGN